jgi:recombination protein RecT
MAATDLSDQLAVRRAQGATTALARPRKTILDLIRDMEDQFRTALPAQLDAKRFVRIAITTVRTNPKLLKCDQDSLLACLMLSAQLGLEPGGPLGHAYLVPFGNELTFIVGYRGYIDLARRSGDVRTVYAEPVYDGDVFRVAKGLHRDIVHEPGWKVGGALTHAYSVARIRDEEPQFWVGTKEKIDTYRKRSKAGGNGPWVTDYEAMALKTTVRRLVPWLPMSVQMARAVVADEATITPDVTLESLDEADAVDVIEGEAEEVDEATGEKREPTAEEVAAAERKAAEQAQGDPLKGQP